jgi:hypothetical protein
MRTLREIPAMCSWDFFVTGHKFSMLILFLKPPDNSLFNRHLIPNTAYAGEGDCL